MDYETAWNPDVREYLIQWGIPERLIDVVEKAPKGAQGMMAAALRKDPFTTEAQLLEIVDRYKRNLTKHLQKYTLSESESAAAEFWRDENTRKWFAGELVRRRGTTEYDSMLDRRVLGEVRDFIDRNRLRERISGYTWPTLLRLSTEWHEAVARGGAGKVYGQKNVVMEFDGGFTIVKIMSGNDMVVEGRKLHGCHGDYAQDVEAGTMDVYSLRDPDNEPIVSIGIKGGAVIQCKAANNKFPMEKYHMFLIDLLKEIIAANIKSEKSAYNAKIASAYAKTLPQWVLATTMVLGGDPASSDELCVERIKENR